MQDGTLLSNDEIRDLVRPDHVHRRAYVDPAIFELELERIFGRLWIYVAHESQLKKPGDFVRTHLAGNEVLITRHEAGKIRVLHNRCPHRGARICMVDHGTSRLFSCPYHAWVFRPDGSLASVPHRKSYPANFDLDDPQNHMQPAGQIAIYRGFVFANLNENPPPLAEHLGPMTEVIDNLVDRAPDGEVEMAQAGFTLEYRGNWKLHLENAADIFHPTFVHNSSVLPARHAPANASIIDQDQTREMLLANGFGTNEWEGIQLTGLAGGHTFMKSFYNSGVLVHEDSDPVAVRYKAALVEPARLGARSRVLGDAPVQQHHLPEPDHQRAVPADARHHPAGGRPHPRAHPLLPPQGRAGRDVPSRGALPHHARLAGLDDLLRRRRDAGALPAGPGERGRALDRLLARPRQRSPRRPRAASPARPAKCRCACSSRPGSTT